MGISRSSLYKKRLTGGYKKKYKKKKKTKLSKTTIIKKHRVRGGRYKYRGIKLKTGYFVWKSMGLTIEGNIEAVVLNFSSERLARKKILVKGSIVRIKIDDTLKTKRYLKNSQKLSLYRNMGVIKRKRLVKSAILYARITSRPGQNGLVQGTVLEGNNLKLLKKVSNNI